MLYLALGAAALGFFLWLGRGRPVFRRREWRIASVAAFAAAAFLAARGGWAFALAALVLGLWFAASARSPAGPGAARTPASGGMSLAEARAILGVGPDASPDEIKAAYGRLIRRNHPDAGGSAGLAAQLNAARDRLLKG